LDVSVIDELPAGRTPITTFSASEKECMERIDKAVSTGHQAYVVFPLVEESETLFQKTGKTVRAATLEFEKLKTRFPGHRLGLLHGQMSSADKQTVMDAFRKGVVSILVATPVIEVGIDVPNATTIVIVNPERFGLSQLHQLRGRVGRGTHASECVLMHPPLDEEVNPRLQIFCAIADGFRLAEEDLQLRGPGEFIGEAQHGLPFFKVGNLLKDGLLISRAREAAASLVRGDLALTVREFGNLNRALQKRFGSKIQLSRVG
jgi:ATP-dependent DNA helicase RecG